MAQETVSRIYDRVDKDALVRNACDDLMTYGLWDAKIKMKRWVRKNLFRQQTAPEDLIFWTTGLLAAGLWRYRKEFGKDAAQEDQAGKIMMQDEKAKQIDQALGAYYARWAKRGCPVFYLDDLLAGETLLAAYEDYREDGKSNDFIGEGNVQSYQKMIEKLAEYGLNYPVDEIGSFPYREAQNNGYVFVDTIGLACPFLYRYGLVYHRTDTMELAVKQIVNFVAYGMDGSTGLPYHGYVTHTAWKYGIIGWGRATGWLLRGMVGCMISEYGEERLRDSYLKLIEATLSYQHKDGYFSWQLQALDGPVDTSATGLICVALKQGIELGILTDSKYEQALQAGRNAVYRSVKDGRVYDCSGECEGFGQYPQRYGTYPWALGPALML